jgi:serine/threonine protein kinase
MMGKFELLALLARGGMAEIYLARQRGIRGFEKLAVVKRILPGLSSDDRFTEMFLDEARLAAGLNHPNIVQIYDLGQDGNDYFIAMEYLEGESLGYLVSEARKAKKPVPPELAAGIVLEVCAALHYAHTRRDDNGNPLNIVHRDVSPHNIIVLFAGAVKLVDFGVAKAASQSHKTRPGMWKGKLHYLTPEQCRGKPVDARTDVFSLGVVMWELLASRRMYMGDNDGAVMNAILNEPAPRIRDRKPEVPEDLESIALRALNKDPDKRFQSAGEMGDAIQAYLKTNKIAAGSREIAGFVKVVFAGRIKEKEALLQGVRAGRIGDISLEILKPETRESFPSKFSSMELRGGGDAHQALDRDKRLEDIAPLRVDGESPEDHQVTMGMKIPRIRVIPPHLKKRALVFMLVAVPVLVLLIVAVLWPTRDGPVTAEKTEIQAVVPDDEEQDPKEGEGSQQVVEVDKVVAGTSTSGTQPEPILLEIRSRPSGCTARLDGKEVARPTPVEDLEVESGKEHEVEVLCKGHRKEVKRFTGGSGEHITLSFSPRPRKPARLKTGVLNLTTVPWSEIYLGKRKIGITPVVGVKLPPGRYTLTASNKDRGIRKTIKVKIKPGETTNLSIHLTKPP